MASVRESIEKATEVMERANKLLASCPMKPQGEKPEEEKTDPKAEDGGAENGDTENGGEDKKEETTEEKLAKLEERIKALEDQKKETEEENASLKTALEKASAQMGKMCAYISDPANVQFASGEPVKPQAEGGKPAPKAKSVFEQWAALPAGSRASRDFYAKHEAEIVQSVNA